MTSSENFIVWFTGCGFILAVVSSLVGGTWILRGMFQNFSDQQDDKVQKALETADKKVARVYERLDEYKTFIEGKMDGQLEKYDSRYVCQTVCNILHAKTAEQVAELKQMMQEGFKRLEEKIDKK